MAKILIAEDERPISELVKRNLMLVGHTAAQAFDGPCALEMAGAERFDLVLLDVMLPGCSGFEVKEQLDRVEAVLRRVHAGAEVFDLGDCHVEFGTHRVFVAGREVALTPQEFMLLGVLVRNRNLALSREKLLQLAWGYDYEGDTRTVDVHIQKLRKKLGFEDRIQTVYKLGYRLSTKE